MDVRPLTPTYAVSPQVLPEDLPAIAAAGFITLVCNRPDPENPPDLQAAAMQRAAEAAGLRFVYNPLVHGAITEAILDVQRESIAEGGKTLAYCASGTRSTMAWMLGAAQDTAPDALLAMANRAGYALDALRPQLEARHNRSSG